MIKKFTITGADDSIQPAQLLRLTREFPFVEWGILISKSSIGQNRFPSFDWLHCLARFQNSLKGELQLSAHLCGRYVKQILVDNTSVVHDLNDTTNTPIWPIFSRVQINTHGEKHDYTLSGLQTLAEHHSDKEFIFQYDNVNDDLIRDAVAYGVKCSTLFDLSHGAGVLPSEWPEPLNGISCGYAGGLSPENLSQQIELILEKAGSKNVWIDIETHVRSNGDRLFDLDKVRTCLEIAKPFIM